MVVEKNQKPAMMIVIPSEKNIRRKKEVMWKVKTKAIPVIIGALEAVTPEMEEWPLQVLRTTLRDLYPEERTVRNSQDISQNPQFPPLRPW